MNLIDKIYAFQLIDEDMTPTTPKANSKRRQNDEENEKNEVYSPTTVDEKTFNGIFNKVRKACNENKLNRLNLADIFHVMNHKVTLLQRRNDHLTRKLDEMAEMLDFEKQSSIEAGDAINKTSKLIINLQNNVDM